MNDKKLKGIEATEVVIDELGPKDTAVDDVCEAPEKTAMESGGHDPMDAFKNYADAQGFIIALRTHMLKGTKKTDIVMQGKIYAVCDLASSAVYLQEQIAKDTDFDLKNRVPKFLPGEVAMTADGVNLDTDQS